MSPARYPRSTTNIRKQPDLTIEIPCFWSNENRGKAVPFEVLSSHKFARFHPIIESFRIVPAKARESHRNGIHEP